MNLPHRTPLLALCGALAFAGVAVAAPDKTGTVTAAAPVFSWDGAEQSSLAPLFEPTLCSSSGPPRYCEQTLIEVKDNGKLVVKLSDFGGGDVDLFLYESDASGSTGEEVGESINTGDSPESVTVTGASGFYLAYANYYDTLSGGKYKGTATLTPASAPAPAPSPGTGPSPAPGPAPAPAPGPGIPPSGALTAEVKLDKAKLKSVLRRGVPATIGCTVACKGKLTLTAKLGRKKATIGSATFSATNKQHKVAIKLSKKAAKALKRAKRVKVTLTAAITDSNGTQAKRVTRSATYKR